MIEKNSFGASFSAWTRPVNPLPTELFRRRDLFLFLGTGFPGDGLGTVAESRLSFLAAWNFSSLEILASISLMDIVVMMDSS